MRLEGAYQPLVARRRFDDPQKACRPRMGRDARMRSEDRDRAQQHHALVADHRDEAADAFAARQRDRIERAAPGKVEQRRGVFRGTETTVASDILDPRSAFAQGFAEQVPAAVAAEDQDEPAGGAGCLP